MCVCGGSGEGRNRQNGKKEEGVVAGVGGTGKEGCIGQTGKQRGCL